MCNIINFDFPPNVTSYIHRVGRTARGNNHGTALSMVAMTENDIFKKVSKELNVMMFKSARKVAGKTVGDGIFKNYAFDLKQLDGFR